MPLISALSLRRSIREYADRPLPPQILSDLLWAAFGVNRPSGDRTALGRVTETPSDIACSFEQIVPDNPYIDGLVSACRSRRFIFHRLPR